jgi:hypothetical protein
MPRFCKFVIQLEYDNEPLTLEELQNDYNEAVQAEDYKEAGKIKKLIDEKLNNKETEFVVELEDYCYIDLDEVATFYKADWQDGSVFTKVILKGGYELPLSIDFDEFTKIFFNLNTHGNA